MKQDFPPAKSHSPRIGVRAVALIIVLVLQGSACVRRPRYTRVVTYLNSQEAVPENSSRININTVNAQELEKLPGVGKVIAERIIDHRKKYGPFRRPEHLMMVRGISDNKFRNLRGLITTE